MIFTEVLLNRGSLVVHTQKIDLAKTVPGATATPKEILRAALISDIHVGPTKRRLGCASR